MIFLCVGSREYQFNRLLKKVDELIASGEIKEEVFGQIGLSTYIPKKFEYAQFLSMEEFKSYQNNAELIISHGGTGALIGALRLGKSVISVPRLSKYGEHTDDHQLQVSTVLEKEGYLKCVIDIDDLMPQIKLMQEKPIIKIYDRPSMVLEIIDDYISKI